MIGQIDGSLEMKNQSKPIEKLQEVHYYTDGKK